MEKNNPLQKVSRNIVLTTLIGLGLLSVIVVIMVQYLSNLSHEQSDITQGLLYLKDARFAAVQVQQFMNDASLTHDKESLTDAQKNRQAGIESVTKLGNLHPELKPDAETYIKMINELTVSGEKMTAAYTEQGLEAGNKIMKEPDTGFDARCDNLSNHIEKIISGQEKEHKENDESIKKILFAMPILVGLLAGLIAIIMFLSVKVIIRQAFKVLVDDLSTTSNEVTAAVNNISQMSLQLSNTAQNCAASIEQVNASSNLMLKSIQQNNVKVGDTTKLANESVMVMSSSTQKMNELLKAVHSLKVNSSKISEITNLIDDIAFQTNLLALNAAVEAARAGEQGKGFAVVAEAVRNLAGRSAVAAKDISSLINEAVKSIDVGMDVASDVQLSVENLSKVLTDISAGSSVVLEASLEQEVNIKEVGTAVQNIDIMAQGNAASAEELAATSTEIASQAENLHSLVNDLKTAMGS